MFEKPCTGGGSGPTKAICTVRSGIVLTHLAGEELPFLKFTQCCADHFDSGFKYPLRGGNERALLSVAATSNHYRRSRARSQELRVGRLTGGRRINNDEVELLLETIQYRSK